MSELDDFVADFRQESQESLRLIEARIMAMEAGDHEAVNEVFRALHSMKGGSSFFDLMHINRVAHQLENILDEVRDGRRAITQDLTDLLLRGADLLESMLAHPACGEEHDIEPMLEAIANYAGYTPCSTHTILLGEASATTAADQPEPIPDETSSSPPPFGTWLVQQDHLEATIVLQALITQQQLQSEPLQVLSDLGLSAEACLTIANHSGRQHQHPFETGYILGLINQQQADEARQVIEQSRPPLGQILVQNKIAEAEQVREWLHCYFDMTSGSL
jgi:chemotaxis protein histidine kinase CheA